MCIDLCTASWVILTIVPLTPELVQAFYVCTRFVRLPFERKDGGHESIAVKEVWTYDAAHGNSLHLPYCANKYNLYAVALVP